MTPDDGNAVTAAAMYRQERDKARAEIGALRAEIADYDRATLARLDPDATNSQTLDSWARDKVFMLKRLEHAFSACMEQMKDAKAHSHALRNAVYDIYTRTNDTSMNADEILGHVREIARDALNKDSEMRP